ncbi:MAG: sigma-54-dependent Fis family transcriptional regulator [Magnetococcales bacterium]|nr:sigma-54-dependent Fis family transcriptional regulator [Magnetococcales bacterium]
MHETTESLTILVIDDEPAIRQILASTLAKAGYTTEAAHDGAEALRRLERGNIDIAICDIQMPGMDGVEVVQQAKSMGMGTIFLMMTAFASVDTAVKAMKAGAYDYLTKPLRKENILHRLRQVADVIALRDQNRTLRNLVKVEEKNRCRFSSAAMLKIDRLVRKVAPTDFTAIITGESGTGKGIVARQIHQRSKRSGELFIPINCGSIPENLMESEFFGHVKGAFTGADKVKKGLFLEADKGTLFLDEIGELPLSMQVKLLHILEEKQVRPVGSEKFRAVDVRIIAATNRDLKEMTTAGTFREDLYFRLNVFNIHIPPLRLRTEDIPVLVDYFLKNSKHVGRSESVWRVDPDAESALMNYPWPGNVRELENVIERALILVEDGVITLHDLPGVVVGQGGDDAVGRTVAKGTLRDRMRHYEILAIHEAIKEAAGDRRAAARALGIGLSSLYRKLELAGPQPLSCD